MTPPIDGIKIKDGSSARLVLDNLDAHEKNILLNVLKEQLEKKSENTIDSQENLVNRLQFEKDTFKIDSTRWEVPTEGKFVGKGVKVNLAGDVVEDPETGEQIFIGYDNFLNYVAEAKGCTKQEVEKKYLMTVEQFEEKMKNMPVGSQQYKDFYNRAIKDRLVGYWYPDDKNFYGVDKRFSVWLVGGSYATFHKDKYYHSKRGKDFGCSGYLIPSKGRAETSIERLPETPQSKKRNAMFDYSKQNESPEDVERIKGWLKTINEFRAKGIIVDSDKGVEIKGLCKLASTKEHNKVLAENFGDKVKEPYNWKDHSGNNSKINTVRKADLDQKMDQGGLKGDWNLASKGFITDTIFPWIEQYFKGVKSQDDKLYILQLINPDLFTGLWLDSKDFTGHFRREVELGRDIGSRFFDELQSVSTYGGLFLV